MDPDVCRVVKTRGSVGLDVGVIVKTRGSVGLDVGLNVKTHGSVGPVGIQGAGKALRQ